MENEEYEKNNDTLEDQLIREREKWSSLQLNRADRDWSIQPPDVLFKRSRQDCLANPAPGWKQPAQIKDKISILANVIRSVSNTTLVSNFYIHLATILVSLSTECDDSGSNNPLFLKGAGVSHYWNDF